MFDEPVFVPHPRWAEYTRLMILAQWVLSLIAQLVFSTVAQLTGTTVEVTRPTEGVLAILAWYLYVGGIVGGYLWAPVQLVAFEVIVNLRSGLREILSKIYSSGDVVLVIVLYCLMHSSGLAVNSALAEYKAAAPRQRMTLGESLRPENKRTIEQDIALSVLEDRVALNHQIFVGAQCGFWIVGAIVATLRTRRFVAEWQTGEDEAA